MKNATWETIRLQLSQYSPISAEPFRLLCGRARTNDALFQPGQIRATPAAVRAMQQTAADPEDYLRRHFSGNWGIVTTKDRRANDSGVREGRPIISAYRLNDGNQVLIITEGDRSATTILLPEDCPTSR